MAYDEDEQQARFQQWWQENWKALAAGLVIGIGGIFGWNAWQSHQEQQAEVASTLFSEMSAAVDAGQLQKATELHQGLIDAHGGSPYAVAASMRLAAARASGGEFEAAAALLRWSKEHADDSALSQLAQLRLARVLWAQGDAEAALVLLDQELGPYTSAAAELRGDILVAQDKRAEARSAYAQALASAPREARELLQQKLDDLADVAEAQDA
ncbi:MAG: tetratricopeptide repeat protein [Algiphilus sp.]|uniref:YfgM family protein n=2 Tax=Algiphilus sp. TaxID=1872431 RepID=UPI001CA6AC00|nr:tetratricopeptide repeat protein [Algiphilus acroporae]